MPSEYSESRMPLGFARSFSAGVALGIILDMAFLVLVQIVVVLAMGASL